MSINNYVYFFISPSNRIESMEEFVQRDRVFVSADQLRNEAAEVAAPLFGCLSQRCSATTIDFFPNKIVLHILGGVVQEMEPQRLSEGEVEQFSKIIAWIARCAPLLRGTEDSLSGSNASSTDATEVKRPFSAERSWADMGQSSGTEGHVSAGDTWNYPFGQQHGPINTPQEVEKFDQLKLEMARLEGKHADLNSELEKARANILNLTKSQNRSERRTQALKREKQALEERITCEKQALEGLTQEKKGIQEDLLAARQQLACWEDGHAEDVEDKAVLRSQCTKLRKQLREQQEDSLETEMALKNQLKRLREEANQRDSERENFKPWRRDVTTDANVADGREELEVRIGQLEQETIRWEGQQQRTGVLITHLQSECAGLNLEIKKTREDIANLTKSLEHFRNQTQVLERQKQALEEQYDRDYLLLVGEKANREMFEQRVNQQHYDIESLQTNLEEAKERYARLQELYNKAIFYLGEVEEELGQKTQQPNEESEEIQQEIQKKEQQIRELNEQVQELTEIIEE